MKDLNKVIAIIAALVLVKRLIDGKPVCLKLGPAKICNY